MVYTVSLDRTGGVQRIMPKVIKKNGTVETWNFDKIVNAICKSAKRADAKISNDELKQVKRKQNNAICRQ